MSPLSRPTRLGAVSLSVPDPEATSSFLRDALGFTVFTSAEGLWHASCPGEYGIPAPASMVSLHRGGGEAEGATLNGLKFDVDDPVDRELIASRVATSGLQVGFEGDRGLFVDQALGESLYFVDPNGVRVCCGPAGPRYQGTLGTAPIRPRRLGHVNVTVADPAASVDCFVDLLGLRLSEQIGEAFYFLRVGSEHHNLGIRTGGPQPGAHHLGFEVNGWESYRVVCDHLVELGLTVEYGPGRHGPGRNIFVYVRDPSSGLRVELYSDMAHIQDEASYVPPRWEVGQRGTTVNRWGPGPPQSFLE